MNDITKGRKLCDLQYFTSSDDLKKVLQSRRYVSQPEEVESDTSEFMAQSRWP